jgi:arylsulfatase A-like enzyme
LTAAVLIAATPAQAKAETRPNVVLVVLDTLRADRVEAERDGVPLMPNLKRFMAGATNFTHAVSPSSWTRPAVASLFTSLYVDTHRVFYSSGDPVGDKIGTDVLPDTMETMASFLKEAGYATAGIQVNSHLDESLGFARGFDSYEYKYNARADWVTARALQILDAAKEPHFLYVHYMDPHDRYDPPSKYRALMGVPEDLDDTDRRWTENFYDCVLDLGYFLGGFKSEREYPDPSPRGMEAVRALYDGEVKYLDDQLGPLLERLAEAEGGTLTIVVADHGEEFWDHGFLMHSIRLYEEQVHVPFAIRGPGMAASRIPETVETLDILPTIAGILGMPPREHWQGTDLFAPGRNGTRPAFSSTRSIAKRFGIHVDQVQLGNLKLVLDRVSGQTELYDLKTDPGERVNLAAERPEVVADLSRLLDAHAKPNAERAQAFGEDKQVGLNAELAQELKALGYF